jgi:hypothetical protein
MATRTRLPVAFAWIPWWLSVIMAIGSYLFLKYLGPQLALSAGHAQLAGFLPQTAPLAAIVFLLIAAKQLYDQPQTEDRPSPDESTDDDDHFEAN